MNKFVKIFSILFILLMLNLPFIPAFIAETVNVQQDPDDDTVSVLQTTYFYMRKNNLMHPESPQGDDNVKTLSCPPKKEPLHERLPGKIFFQYVWRSVPVNFESNPVNKQVTIGNQAKFKLWFAATSGNLDTVRFKFTLLHNGNSIAQSDVVEFPERLNDGSDGEIHATAGVNITNSRLDVGDTLGLHIDYLVNGEGLKIKYDNPVYDSGFEVDANPIKLTNIQATPHRITTTYREAFNVKLVTLSFIAKVDDTPIIDLPQYSSSKEGPQVYWDVDLPSGRHIITIMASYGSTDNESWVVKFHDVEIVIQEPWAFLGIQGNTWTTIIGLIVVAVIIGIGIRIWKGRRDDAELERMLKT
jgi:hypothetical protein